MSSAVSIDLTAGSARHPWLAALVAAPEAEMRALVGLHADVHP
jgi:hypothetical protein